MVNALFYSHNPTSRSHFAQRRWLVKDELLSRINASYICNLTFTTFAWRLENAAAGHLWKGLQIHSFLGSSKKKKKKKKGWTYPLEVQTWGGWDSTCDSLYHSHRRTEADPGRQKHSSSLHEQPRSHFNPETSKQSLKTTHIILRCAAHVAAFALYALPAVRLDGGHHYRSELQAGGVACVEKRV